MARCIRDDELAFIRGEETVSDINGNALLAFRRKAVDKQRKVYFIALRARFFTVFLNVRELIFIDKL